ncbi:MAG TPA: biotin transporter BioY [Gemmatimonadaceae bacterium]|jgi:biotin transport system substrate-specific component
MSTLLTPVRSARDTRVALVGITGFAIALAAASQVAIPLPLTPVPITLQPLVVALAGLMLGPTAGAASMVLYLAAGAAGLPVFAPIGAPGIARFFGPTGGYLIAYPAAAFVAGVLARREPSLVGRWLAATAGVVVILFGGVAQLAIVSQSVGRAIAIGLTPFALLDIVKAFVAALIAGRRLPSIRQAD